MSSVNTKVSSKTSKRKVKSTRATIPGVSFVRSKEYINEYRLISNGLTILSVHVPDSPTVTTNIVYLVGSQHESMGETGLAHMLEHMLFKPTTTDGITWKDLEDKGGLLNATTWLDRTMYYFNLPNEYLEDMLRVEADRMRNVALIDREFQPERTNVLSEYEMYNSRPEMVLEWNMVSTAFQAHGYKHETIGFKNDIERYTVEQLRAFYDKHYWPNNATLVVVGDLDEHALLRSIKSIFGRITPGPDIKRGSTEEQKQEGLRRVVLERKTPIRVFHAAFKAPRFLERDWTALSLFLDHLTEGTSSILYKKLVETGLANSVMGVLYPTKDPYLASIQVFASEKGKYAEIEDILFETIESSTKEKIPAQKVAQLKQHAYVGTLFDRDGTLRIASTLAEYIAAGDWTRYFDALDEIHLVTERDIVGAAAKYLVRPSAVIGTIENPAS